MVYQKSKKIKKHFKFYISVLFFVFLFLILIYKNFTNSVFFKKKDRINIVFYGEESFYYSLGEVNYFLSFPSDIELLFPGGYGYYRLGGLGKLVFLEKRPEIFRMTFSSATSSAVDLYFYPSVPQVHYGEKKTTEIVFPSLNKIFFNKSNGNIVDRLFLAFYFIAKKPSDYKIISNFSLTKEEDRALFDEERFFRENQGLFYKKTYRNIKNNVQIVYTKSYKTGLMLSRIIEGEGIRVVDITQVQDSRFKVQGSEKCLVIEESKKASLVANDLQKFFGCQFKRGETEISDIILVLGKLEKDWEVK